MAIGKSTKPHGAVVKWAGKQVQKVINLAAANGLRKVAATAQVMVVAKISKSARPGTGGTRFPKPGAGPPMRKVHSKPGEPPRSDGGKLKQSIFWDIDVARLKSVVRTELKYGKYLELGTKSHPISAKRKKSLAYPGTDPDTGAWTWIFKRAVHHPGTAPRPYLWKTVEDNVALFRNMMIAEMKKHIAFKGTAKLTLTKF